MTNFSVFGLLFFVGLFLLSVVDIRRAFLFSSESYFWKSSFASLSIGHFLMLAIAIAGIMYFCKKTSPKSTKVFLAGLFVLLLVDVFIYRGVAVQRSLAKGIISADWLKGFEVTGVGRVFSLTLSYLLTVWHATFLSGLFASLAMLVLPRFFNRFQSDRGWRGVVAGTIGSLTQPFCSCCAALVSPSLWKKGNSGGFVTSLLLGAPLLNLTSLFLALQLLPTTFAFIRVLGGLLMTVAISFVFSKMLVTNSCELPVAADQMDAEDPIFIQWYNILKKIFRFLIPGMIFGSVMASLVWSFWPAHLENTPTSVVFSSLMGTVVMVSTWTEIPLSLQLIESGLTGPAAALLLALPAVNVGSLLMLYQVSKSWKYSVGLGLSVFLFSSLVGFIFI